MRFLIFNLPVFGQECVLSFDDFFFHFGGSTSYIVHGQNEEKNEQQQRLTMPKRQS